MHFKIAKRHIPLMVLLLAGSALAQSPNISEFASGFNNPRGLKFGPDGYLYVAEGGAGGSLSTVGLGLCDQAAGPPAGPGPYTGGFTARISKIDPSGVVSTVADHLPSDQTSAAFGNLVSGVADIAFVHNKLYALIAGAGCSHGLAGTHNGIIRVHQDGSWKQIADLSSFQKAHPTANPEPDDFEPDGTWYSMVAVDSHDSESDSDDHDEGDGVFFAVEPNHGELDAVSLDGAIRRVSDISLIQGHIVPTAIRL
jgi:hypothetical protein